ncbi:hypothetical protein D3C85_1652250 [compost metagenome]
MVEAYKSRIEQLSGWTSDENERVRNFAAWLTEGLQSLIDQETQRVDRSIELRKYQYGSDPKEE